MKLFVFNDKEIKIFRKINYFLELIYIIIVYK